MTLKGEVTVPSLVEAVVSPTSNRCTVAAPSRFLNRVHSTLASRCECWRRFHPDDGRVQEFLLAGWAFVNYAFCQLALE